jgi:hypothetical protein
MCYTIYDPTNIFSSWYVKGNFQKFVTQYQDDPYILNITDICKNVEDEVYCVWKNIPYDYNYNRSAYNPQNLIIDPLILEPKEYFASGGKGVCRDNAVITKAVLDNLNISNVFILKPHHVYIEAYYHDKTYIINTRLEIREDNKVTIYT